MTVEADVAALHWQEDAVLQAGRTGMPEQTQQQQELPLCPDKNAALTAHLTKIQTILEQLEEATGLCQDGKVDGEVCGTLADCHKSSGSTTASLSSLDLPTHSDLKHVLAATPSRSRLDAGLEGEADRTSFTTFTSLEPPNLHPRRMARQTITATIVPIPGGNHPTGGVSEIVKEDAVESVHGETSDSQTATNAPPPLPDRLHLKTRASSLLAPFSPAEDEALPAKDRWVGLRPTSHQLQQSHYDKLGSLEVGDNRSSLSPDFLAYMRNQLPELVSLALINFENMEVISLNEVIHIQKERGQLASRAQQLESKLEMEQLFRETAETQIRVHAHDKHLCAQATRQLVKATRKENRYLAQLQKTWKRALDCTRTLLEHNTAVLGMEVWRERRELMQQKQGNSGALQMDLIGRVKELMEMLQQEAVRQDQVQQELEKEQAAVKKTSKNVIIIEKEPSKELQDLRDAKVRLREKCAMLSAEIERIKTEEVAQLEVELRAAHSQVVLCHKRMLLAEQRLQECTQRQKSNMGKENARGDASGEPNQRQEAVMMEDTNPFAQDLLRGPNPRVGDQDSPDFRIITEDAVSDITDNVHVDTDIGEPPTETASILHAELESATITANQLRSELAQVKSVMDDMEQLVHQQAKKLAAYEEERYEKAKLKHCEQEMQTEDVEMDGDWRRGLQQVLGVQREMACPGEVLVDAVRAKMDECVQDAQRLEVAEELLKDLRSQVDEAAIKLAAMQANPTNAQRVVEQIRASLLADSKEGVEDGESLVEHVGNMIQEMAALRLLVSELRRTVSEQEQKWIDREYEYLDASQAAREELEKERLRWEVERERLETDGKSKMQLVQEHHRNDRAKLELELKDVRTELSEYKTESEKRYEEMVVEYERKLDALRRELQTRFIEQAEDVGLREKVRNLQAELEKRDQRDRQLEEERDALLVEMDRLTRTWRDFEGDRCSYEARMAEQDKKLRELQTINLEKQLEIELLCSSNETASSLQGYFLRDLQELKQRLDEAMEYEISSRMAAEKKYRDLVKEREYQYRERFQAQATQTLLL